MKTYVDEIHVSLESMETNSNLMTTERSRKVRSISRFAYTRHSVVIIISKSSSFHLTNMIFDACAALLKEKTIQLQF